MKIYGDSDASLSPVEGKIVAILGYGNQGQAQALNLRDNGVSVVIGNREDEYLQLAKADGFDTASISEAAKSGDYLFVLTTDESQPHIWEEQIAPGLEVGNTIVWASGYNVGFDLITPPDYVDVVMVAPRMTGSMVRELFEGGSGAMAQVAVQQDASGNAWERMMAVAKGIGATRGGVIVSSFREEAELDLFAEQVVWSGLVAWFELCFELGVESGFSPELMVLELYASGEASEILGLMARNGFYKQMSHHSTTSQYGTLSRSRNLIPDDLRKQMRHLLHNDVKGGGFVREWSQEQAEGSKVLERLRSAALVSDMAQAEDKVIPVVQKANTEE
jgi:ketol-acid reductoisomerase